MLQDNVGWAGLAVVVLVVIVAFAIWATRRRSSARAGDALAGHRRLRRRRPARDHFRTESADDATSEPVPPKQAAVVVNPTKFNDVSAVRARITKICTDAGWAEPLWLETTKEDPGYGQAKQALGEGVDLVCPLGGDGTVRCVASALVGTRTPLGLLPGGTGNLLARNLGLPVDDLAEALRIALNGKNRRVDVGRVTVDKSGEHEQPEEHIFLIMAGIGFDAAVMADAPEKLKNKVGWLAYGVSGVKNLRGAGFKAWVTHDDAEEVSRRVRTVVIGNCGKLTGGLVLMPDAKLDDGWLDTVVLSPRGLVGWVAVAGRVITRRQDGHQRVDHARCKKVHVRTDRPIEVQLDGDTLGEARALTAWVDPLSLTVRVDT